MQYVQSCGSWLSWRIWESAAAPADPSPARAASVVGKNLEFLLLVSIAPYGSLRPADQPC